MSFGGNVKDKDLNLQYHKIGKKNPFVMTKKWIQCYFIQELWGLFAPKLGAIMSGRFIFPTLLLFKILTSTY